MTRSPKKSEMLEVRLAHVTKRAFAEHCRSKGISVSQAVRDLIDQHLDGPAQHVRTRRRLAIAGLAGLALGAAAGPTLAETWNAQTHAARFAALDANGDGLLNLAEYRGH